MSGAPVLVGDRVVGIVSARYNSADGWARDTVWVARSEDLEALLAGLTELRPVQRTRTGSAALTSWYPLDLEDGRFVRLAPPYDDLPGDCDFSLTPSAALRDNYGLVPFSGRESELQELKDWTRSGGRFAVISISGRSGVGKSRLARQLCAQLIPLGWRVGFAQPADSGSVKDALGLEKPAVIVVEIDSGSQYAKLAVDLIESLSGNLPTHPVRLIVISRALAGQAWEQILLAAEQRGIYAERQISLDKVAFSGDDQTTHYRAALEAFSRLGRVNARLGLDRPREVEAMGGAIDLGKALRSARLGQNSRDLRSILLDRAGGPPRSILLVHLAALLDVLAGEGGRTEATGPHLLDKLLRREAAYWQNIFGWLGVDAELQLDIVAVASFVTAETRSDAKRLLRSLEDLRGRSFEERRGAIANALHGLYSSDGRFIGPVRPDILSERLVVCRILTREGQLRRILANVCSDSQRLHMINVLDRAMLNPAVGGSVEVLLRARELVQESRWPNGRSKRAKRDDDVIGRA